MKIRVISVASPRSNLMGTLEIECSHLGLAITYVDAYLVTGEGAPVPIDPGQGVFVPWSRVRDARVVGEAVAFEIDPAPLPEQRLLLVRFSPGRDASPHRIYQQRVAYRITFLVLASIAAIVTSLAVPLLAPDAGWRTAIASGGGVGVALVALGIGVDWVVASGGMRSRVVRELFVGELLALVPTLPREPVGISLKNARWPRIETIVPHATVGVAAALAVVALVPMALPASLVAASATLVEIPLPPHAAVSAEPAAPPKREARVTGACDCAGAKDALRGEPLPSASLLVLGSRQYVRSGRTQTEADLAVVNNGNRDLYDVASVIEFFEQDPSVWAKPTVVSRRPVFFAGPIGPGQAIKWHVDAEGSNFKVRPLTRGGLLLTGTIGSSGEGAATPGQIASLLKAHNVAVRLHGAMLLAFLDDPHAPRAIADLKQTLGEPEGVYLGRLLEQVGELRTCRLAVVDYGSRRRVSVCIANAADAARPNVDLVVRALDGPVVLRDPVAAPPEVLFDGTAAVPGGVGAKTGVSVELDLGLVSLAKHPAAFEAIATAK